MSSAVATEARPAPLPRPAWLGSVRDRWLAYWFGPGFELSHAVCRIAIALALLYTDRYLFDPDYAAFLRAQNPALYRPVGIMYVISPDVPPPELCETLRLVTRVSAYCVVLGLFTRLSLLAGVLSASYLCGLAYAFMPSWSHQHQPILLPALALLFGPPAPWSLDAALRKALGRPAPDYAGCRAAVLAAQFIAAAIFLNAGLYKAYLGNRQFLAWCYSDNLRNVLHLQYWVLNEDMPPLLRWVVEHEWAYKAMGWANVLTQLTPVLACFLVRRPVLRFLCGALFSAEVLGLDHVMRIWNPHWLLLLAFFVDWDRLAAWVFRRRTTAPVGVIPARLTAGQSAQAAWLTLFLAAQLVVSFGFRVDRRWTFPLTSFPMYSNVYADRPFGEHRPFTLHGSRWTIDADPPVTEEEYNFMVWRPYYAMPWLTPDLHPLAMQIKSNLERRVPGRVVKSINVEKTAFEILAYPDNRVVSAATALAYQFADGKRVALPYEYDRDQAAQKFVLTLRPVGLTNPTYRFAVYPHFRGEPADLPGELAGDRFTFDHPGPGQGPYYLVIGVRDPALGDREVLFGGPVVY